MMISIDNSFFRYISTLKNEVFTSFAKEILSAELLFNVFLRTFATPYQFFIDDKADIVEICRSV